MAKDPAKARFDSLSLRASMRRWLKAQFADVEHARRAILTVAVALGACGFCVIMGALLLARLT